MRFKALIFDLGNMVFHFNFENTYKIRAKITGLEPLEIKHRLKFDENFQQFERNSISSEEFINHVSSQLNFKLDRNNFEKGWNAIYHDTVPGIENLLIELKRKYRIVALTNTNLIHANIWKKKYADTLTNFEKIFASHEIGFRKPDFEAFQLVLNYLNLEPGQTLFLDDDEEYTTQAKKIGIETILVNSFPDMSKALKELELI